MIGIELVVTRIRGVGRVDLERWILNDWVRPESGEGRYMFREIDVERVRLIRDLREMAIDEEALPVVLSLLDQLYDVRRRMRELGEALALNVPEENRRAVARHLASGPS